MKEISSVKKVEGISVVVFTGVNCPACKALEKSISAIKKDYADKVSFYAISVDDYPEEAAMYSVMSLPTTLVVKNGRIMSELIGNISVSKILNDVKEV